MAVAYLITVLVGFSIAYAMYKSRLVESIVLPILDVLQSVPILGFFPIALYVFISASPSLGPELAAVFLIFTSMAWNIIFGIYQSLITLPQELRDFSKIIGENYALAHVYIPASLRSLYYNSAVSWANAFFFITASEVISIGTEYHLFGIGSYVIQNFEAGDMQRVFLGIAVGTAANLAIYFAVWRKAVVYIPQLPDRLAELLAALIRPTGYLTLFFTLALVALFISNVRLDYAVLIGLAQGLAASISAAPYSAVRIAAVLLLSWAIGLIALALLVHRPSAEPLVLIIFAVISSIPAVFLYPSLAGFLAGDILAVTLLLPGAVIYAVLNMAAARRDVNIDLARSYGIKGPHYLWHVLVPASLGYTATGLLAAWGGAWNAAIVAEPLANVKGLGSYLDEATRRGDLAGMAAALLTMVAIILTVNTLFWKKLYNLASRWS